MPENFTFDPLRPRPPSKKSKVSFENIRNFYNLGYFEFHRFVFYYPVIPDLQEYFNCFFFEKLPKTIWINFARASIWTNNFTPATCCHLSARFWTNQCHCPAVKQQPFLNRRSNRNWSKQSNGNCKSTGTKSHTMRWIRRREEFTVSSIRNEHLRHSDRSPINIRVRSLLQNIQSRR